MASWFNWVTGKRVAPERVPTDTVIPVHWLDDTSTNRCLVLDFSMQFEDVLNVGMMVRALERLLEKPGWRKLGARLRLNANGKLEYHVPAQYTNDRPAISFGHTQYGEMSINEHPLASKLPCPQGYAHIGPTDKELRPLFLDDDSPTKIEDWYHSDRPQLCLHIVSFADATLVTLTWLHTFLDAMSQASLFDAWTAILEDREEDVPEFFGEKRDPLAGLGARIDLDDDGDEEYLLKDQVMTGAKMMKFVFNTVWEQTVYRADEYHELIIPSALFAKIKAEAFNDLKTADPTTLVMDKRDTSNPKPFLSDGDILCAWTHKLFTSCQPWAITAPPSRIIHIMNIFSMTELIQSTEPKLIPKGHVHIGNCTTALSSHFRLDDFLSLPLGLIAARIRSDLVAQTTRPQINALMRLNQAAVKSTGTGPLFGEGDMVVLAFTNWSKGKYWETDFKAAVVRQGNKKDGRAVGKPVMISGSGHTAMITTRNTAACFGQDLQGNWWLSAWLRSETWRNVERKIDEINNGMRI